jgi:hypothetical protein
MLCVLFELWLEYSACVCSGSFSILRTYNPLNACNFFIKTLKYDSLRAVEFGNVWELQSYLYQLIIFKIGFHC